MKKLVSIALSLTLALAAVPCFAAETNIAVSNSLSGVVAANGIDLSTYTAGLNTNVTSAVQNSLSNVVTNGDINVTNLSQLIGTDVTSAAVTNMDSVVSNGDLSITNYADIIGTNNVTAVVGNTLSQYVGNGDCNISTLLNSNGTATTLNEAVQNVLSNAVFSGNLGISTIAQ